MALRLKLDQKNEEIQKKDKENQELKRRCRLSEAAAERKFLQQEQLLRESKRREAFLRENMAKVTFLRKKAQLKEHLAFQDLKSKTQEVKNLKEELAERGAEAHRHSEANKSLQAHIKAQVVKASLMTKNINDLEEQNETIKQELSNKRAESLRTNRETQIVIRKLEDKLRNCRSKLTAWSLELLNEADELKEFHACTHPIHMSPEPAPSQASIWNGQHKQEEGSRQDSDGGLQVLGRKATQVVIQGAIHMRKPDLLDSSIREDKDGNTSYGSRAGSPKYDLHF